MKRRNSCQILTGTERTDTSCLVNTLAYLEFLTFYVFLSNDLTDHGRNFISPTLNFFANNAASVNFGMRIESYKHFQIWWWTSSKLLRNNTIQIIQLKAQCFVLCVENGLTNVVHQSTNSLPPRIQTCDISCHANLKSSLIVQLVFFHKGNWTHQKVMRFLDLHARQRLFQDYILKKYV